jgi:endonuclease YncB( thermonuclease family)
MENDKQHDFSKYDIKTPEFTLNGMCTNGRLVDIIDGDSLSIILPVFDNYYRYSVRINGIDTCELKSKNEANKKLALQARSCLLKLITKNDYPITLTRSEIKQILNENIFIVYLKCLDFDKYGRLLAEIYTIKNDTQDISFSQHLLDNNLAYKYTGQTKLTESEQLDIL